MKNTLLTVGAVVVLIVAYVFLWPVEIDPAPWEPPIYEPDAWSPNRDFASADRVELTDGYGPEDVDVDQRGRVYGGLHDGRIVRWSTLGEPPEVLADTGGRPLGLHWDPQGRLVVADAFKGLLRVTQEGDLETLATECGGQKLVFADDLEVTGDGTVYLSDASVKFDQGDWKSDILESGANGRLCRWREGDSEAEEILPDLHFANGIAIDPEERFVLVNETSRYRVLRYWFDTGRTEVLIDNLPGFPDGISTGANGLFWIAIASPRNALLDNLAPSPFWRRVVQRLPDFLKPKPEKTSRAIGVDAEGQVRYDIWDPAGSKIAMVTSVQERDGKLYFGSLSDNAIAVMARPGDEQGR